MYLAEFYWCEVSTNDCCCKLLMWHNFIQWGLWWHSVFIYQHNNDKTTVCSQVLNIIYITKDISTTGYRILSHTETKKTRVKKSQDTSNLQLHNSPTWSKFYQPPTIQNFLTLQSYYLINITSILQHLNEITEILSTKIQTGCDPKSIIIVEGLRNARGCLHAAVRMNRSMFYQNEARWDDR